MNVLLNIDFCRQGYRLDFVFGDNDYFNNSVLSKAYEIDFMPSTMRGMKLKYYGPTNVACAGSVASYITFTYRTSLALSPNS